MHLIHQPAESSLTRQVNYEEGIGYQSRISLSANLTEPQILENVYQLGNARPLERLRPSPRREIRLQIFTPNQSGHHNSQKLSRIQPSQHQQQRWNRLSHQPKTSLSSDKTNTRLPILLSTSPQPTRFTHNCSLVRTQRLAGQCSACSRRKSTKQPRSYRAETHLQRRRRTGLPLELRAHQRAPTASCRSRKGQWSHAKRSRIHWRS